MNTIAGKLVMVFAAGALFGLPFNGQGGAIATGVAGLAVGGLVLLATRDNPDRGFRSALGAAAMTSLAFSFFGWYGLR